MRAVYFEWCFPKTSAFIVTPVLRSTSDPLTTVRLESTRSNVFQAAQGTGDFSIIPRAHKNSCPRLPSPLPHTRPLIPAVTHPFSRNNRRAAACFALVLTMTFTSTLIFLPNEGASPVAGRVAWRASEQRRGRGESPVSPISWVPGHQQDSCHRNQAVARRQSGEEGSGVCTVDLTSDL